MKLSIAELMLIVDTLDKSLMIGNTGLFTYSRETREGVMKDIVNKLNKIGIVIQIEAENEPSPADAPANS